jgi:hypothetical protein
MNESVRILCFSMHDDFWEDTTIRRALSAISRTKVLSRFNVEALNDG